MDNPVDALDHQLRVEAYCLASFTLGSLLGGYSVHVEDTRKCVNDGDEGPVDNGDGTCAKRFQNMIQTLQIYIDCNC